MTATLSALAPPGTDSVAVGLGSEAVADQSRSRRVLLTLSVVLLILSLLAWRSGQFYSGGVDTVVAAKAGLGSVALAIAAYLLVTADEHAWIGLRTISLVIGYLAVTVIGGMATGSFITDLVLAVRVAMVLVTMVCLVMATPLADLIRYVLGCLAGIGTVLAIVGVPAVLHGGRLAGGLLSVNPNQMALIFGPPALGCLWRMLNDRAGSRDLIWLIGLLGMTWLTGSRTGLVALLVAVVVLLLMAPRLHVTTFLSLIVAVPAVYFAAYFTPLLGSYFGRGGAGKVATLSSRTIAWDAAFSARAGFWQHWFGGGLGVKTVTVTGQYWDTQVLDSSWVSAFVQAGVGGLILLGLWVVVATVGVARAPKPYRALLLAIVVYALIRSILETGLVDSYVLFVVMLFPTLTAERRSVATDPV